MKNVQIIMWCKLNKEDIGQIFDNFCAGYPEVDTDESFYENLEGDEVKFTWEGTVEDEDVDGIIRMTHHAEGLYFDTSAEYVHVEVCVDGKWYGRLEDK